MVTAAARRTLLTFWMVSGGDPECHVMDQHFGHLMTSTIGR